MSVTREHSSVPGRKGQKKGNMGEERTAQKKDKNGTEVSLYHLEVLFHSRGSGAFSKVQELLPTPWKLLELGKSLYLFNLNSSCVKWERWMGTVILTLAARWKQPGKLEKAFSLGSTHKDSSLIGLDVRSGLVITFLSLGSGLLLHQLSGEKSSDL